MYNTATDIEILPSPFATSSHLHHTTPQLFAAQFILSSEDESIYSTFTVFEGHLIMNSPPPWGEEFLCEAEDPL